MHRRDHTGGVQNCRQRNFGLPDLMFVVRFSGDLFDAPFERLSPGFRPLSGSAERLDKEVECLRVLKQLSQSPVVRSEKERVRVQDSVIVRNDLANFLVVKCG